MYETSPLGRRRSGYKTSLDPIDPPSGSTTAQYLWKCKVHLEIFLLVLQDLSLHTHRLLSTSREFSWPFTWLLGDSEASLQTFLLLSLHREVIVIGILRKILTEVILSTSSFW